MANIEKKEKAESLRKQGYSIGEISHLLGVAKSTVSYWCRDITLTSSQEKRLLEKQKTEGLKKIAEYIKLIRKKRLLDTERAMKLGKLDVGCVSKRDLLMIGLALYWAEGYKKGNDEVGFTNSDPVVIKIILKWFKIFYKIETKDFICRISINQIHKTRVSDVLSYWTKVTGISREQFTKMSLIKSQSKKIYTNTHEHFGTLRVKVRKGTFLRRRIMGSLGALQNISKSGKNTRNEVY